MSIPRDFDRGPQELRPVTIQRRFTGKPGAVLYTCGETVVLCTASIEEAVPRWMSDGQGGWLTASYEMLPASTPRRKHKGLFPDGRAQEIKRLIGRSLRSAVDLRSLGPRTIHVDTHVLTADAGTRTAAITGSMIAVADILRSLVNDGELPRSPLKRWVQAVSVGIVDGQPRLDLYYPEDSAADVDLNVVSADGEAIVEVQGTAEGQPFSRETLDELMTLAFHGLKELHRQQREAHQEAP